MSITRFIHQQYKQERSPFNLSGSPAMRNAVLLISSMGWLLCGNLPLAAQGLEQRRHWAPVAAASFWRYRSEARLSGASPTNDQKNAWQRQVYSASQLWLGLDFDLCRSRVCLPGLPGQENPAPPADAFQAADNTQTVNQATTGEPQEHGAMQRFWFVYQLDGRLMYNVGGSNTDLARQINSAGASAEALETQNTNSQSDLQFMPGHNLFIGMEGALDNDTIASLLVGRYSESDALLTELFGRRSFLSGVHLTGANADYGSLTLSLYRPALNAQYLNADHSLAAFPARDNWLQHARNDRSLGLATRYAFHAGAWYAAWFYDQVEQNASDVLSNLEWQNEKLAWLGGGLGYRQIPDQGAGLVFWLHWNRVDGEYYSILKDTNGRRRRHVEGQALSIGLGLHWHRVWSWQNSFFIPQSGHYQRGSAAAADELSGYVGLGSSPVADTLAASLLDSKPWYELCHADTRANNDADCRGLNRNHAEIGQRRPGFIWQSRLQYEGRPWLVRLQTTVIQPLALLDRDPGSQPFGRLKKDTAAHQYREVGLDLGWQTGTGSKFLARYQRLYRKPGADYSGPDQTVLSDSNPGDREQMPGRSATHSQLVAERFYLELQSEW
ncbi:MAG: hypothetical protein KDK39_01480 [Leptospiraceae bacterium]|nr:hypothetical protein [Leptospiraceae bacterium]